MSQELDRGLRFESGKEKKPFALHTALHNLGQNLIERHLAVQRRGKDVAKLQWLRGGERVSSCG